MIYGIHSDNLGHLRAHFVSTQEEFTTFQQFIEKKMLGSQLVKNKQTARCSFQMPKIIPTNFQEILKWSSTTYAELT